MADIAELLNEVADSFKPQVEETVVDTPTSEQPVVETPVVTEEPAADIDTDLKEVTETASTEKVATEAATTETKVATPTFEEQLRELGFTSADEAKAAKAELQQLKERNTLGTLLDKLTGTGVSPETVIAYHKLDLQAKTDAGAFKIGDRQVLDLQLQLKYPSLTNEQRSSMLDEKYGSMDAEDGAFSQAGQGRQVIDATTARQELMAEKAKVLDVKQAGESFESVKNKEFEVAETARVKTWEATPKIKEITDAMQKIGQKISFPILGEDNKPIAKSFEFEHKIAPEAASKIEQSLRVMAINNGLDPSDAKSFESLKSAAENIYFLQNKEAIINDAVKRTSSYFHKYIATTYHGGKETGVTRGAGAGNKDNARLEATMANM